jgi:amidohydrolase
MAPDYSAAPKPWQAPAARVYCTWIVAKPAYMTHKKTKEHDGLLSSIRRAIGADRRRIVALGERIHRTPEVGFKEFQASERITAFLAELGFEVKKPYGGLATAFRARLRGRGAGPSVAVLVEYDALPGLGHGCGHNLITVAGVATACGVRGCRNRWRGTFEVIGTPAEELLAGKSHMAAAKAFDHLDACVMAHPAGESTATWGSNALRSFTATFHGKAAHAACAPEAGINALDAAILFFNSLNALRQHLREDARIHGIVAKGGTSYNVIPELAEVQIGIRSCDEGYLEGLARRVERACRAAARATGATVSIRWDRHWYRAFKLNPALERLVAESFAAAGMRFTSPRAGAPRGSLDMANVSRIVPASHPFFSIVPPGGRRLSIHTREFLRAANSAAAYRAALAAGSAMALAAVRFLSDRKLLAAAKRDFAASRSL